MTAQAEPTLSDSQRHAQKRQQAIKKGVPMNTRHNYFPLEIHGDLAPLICYFFFFFLAAFFLVAMS
jgi:hypothetical protein